MVVVGGAVTEGSNAGLGTKIVGNEGGATEADPLVPVEVALDEVGAHAGRRGENGADTDEDDGSLKGETGVATLSLEELILREQVLVGGLNDLISGLGSSVLSLPAGIVESVQGTEPVVRGVRVHFY